jgi:hypothetical protein
MALKRLGIAILVLGIGFAGSAQAKQAYYTLAAGSGAQLHIGNGLALPVQLPASALVTGMVFPPLLIPLNEAFSKQVIATTTEVGTRQKIKVPAGALKKVASQKTVGVFTSNPTLYAVATAISFNWPAVTATFSVSGRTGPATTTLTGSVVTNKIKYSARIVGKRFGGPGQFNLRPAFLEPNETDPPGILDAQVTVYAIAIPGPPPPPVTGAGGNPPCVHTLLTPVPFPGPGHPFCVAALIEAVPSGLAAQGGPIGTSVMTTPMNVIPAIGVGAFGPGPLHPTGPPGTLSLFVVGTMPGPLNNAASDGFPWTTAKISISAMSAMGGAEVFVISGDDQRTANGAGTIQMVSGSLSTRPLSGDNANRAWLRLVLVANPDVPVPSMSVLGLATTAGLMLLSAGYVMRRRIFA